MVNPAISNISQVVTGLQSLQSAFCLIKLSGDVLVVDQMEVTAALSGTKLGSVDFYKKPAGEVLMKRYLENLPVACDVKKTIGDFWVDPATHLYTEIAFSPIPQPPTTLNYWVKNPIQPSPGNWNVLKAHLLNVICARDPSNYDYLIRYVAHMLQRPEIKPGVMIVLLGGQGTGKGMFFQILQRIWQRTSLLVSDIQQVVGQFNAALERNFVILMDEALFSGDRKSQERMKSFVTEKTLQIEQKHQPSRTINSVHRFFASSNHRQFSHVEADDRRLLFLRVSDQYQANHDYFTTLTQSINDDAIIAAMVHDLLTLDLKGFNIRERPITSEHGLQKILSLQGFDRYWYEVLMNECFDTRDGMHDAWSEPRFISTKSISIKYREFDNRSQRFAPILSKEIADAIKRLCPSAKPDRKSLNNSQARGHDLPDLTVARQEFEAAYKCKVDWGPNLVAPASIVKVA
jgi:hypothetical protein